MFESNNGSEIFFKLFKIIVDIVLPNQNSINW